MVGGHPKLGETVLKGCSVRMVENCCFKGLLPVLSFRGGDLHLSYFSSPAFVGT